ncbi:MAG: hypothetical protein BAA01_01180 [Bacillus thermozeamaize]|uniref:CRISPR system ring nuclease SSO1393-like domain-containing protein n=1 Tax=Bacillus thermozeamaize TaxID=230954 RepID=A0A1Y3PG77_9BACI|nr:MAG: hypothetical protein BAA01_01180 [Bacillus thermozeamaize]
MYHAIVMTSGVSLFGETNYFGKWTRQGDFFQFDGPNLSLKQGVEEEKALQTWLDHAQPLLPKREWQPEKVSAEYSMLHALKRMGKLSGSPSVTLFYTETLDGKAAARLLKRVIEQDFSADVDLRPVQMDITDRAKLNRLLGDYMFDLSRVLRAGDPSFTCFAPIGGYKVMSWFGYLVGSFYGYPTAYLHEGSQQMLHIIPPVPIDIDPEFFRKHSSFIRRLMNEGFLDMEMLTWEERLLVESHASLFTTEDGVVYLNPFGTFLFSRDQYVSELRTKVFVSEAVQRIMEAYPSQQRFIFQQIRVLLEYVKGSQVQKRGELFHERDFEAFKGKTFPYHLYKGASNGGLFRATWRYDDKEDRLYINYLWLAKPYEQEVLRGKGLIQDEGAFADVTKQFYEQL